MPTSTPASATAELVLVARRRSPGFWSDALRRIVKSRAAMSGGVIVGLFVLLAGVGPPPSPLAALRGRVVARLQGARGAPWRRASPPAPPAPARVPCRLLGP